MFKIEIDFWAKEIIEKRLGLKIKGNQNDPRVSVSHDMEAVRDMKSGEFSLCSATNFQRSITKKTREMNLP